jgi:hypothetical protein
MSSRWPMPPRVTGRLTLVLLTCAMSIVGSETGWAQAQPEAAEAAVRDTLEKYSAALESLDVNAVKKVQPSIPADNLARAFRDMRELKVVIDEVRVLSIEGAKARVSCRVTQTLTPKAGSKQTTAVTRVMRLQRAANSWVIVGFER